MKIIWFGHASFRIEIEDQVLLIDPWFSGNPMFPEERRGEAIEGATHILITHGHGDHSSDALSISEATGAPIVGIFDLMEWWGEHKGANTIGFNKGGTVALGDVKVSMVNAVHSSSIGFDEGPLYTGSEAGFMIKGEGHTIYVTGDTDIMADMAWFGEYYMPDIGILCAGGHFTMDMKSAAWAAKKYFNFQTVIPCHYKTFPLLAQDAEELRAGLPGVNVIEPDVFVPLEI